MIVIDWYQVYSICLLKAHGIEYRSLLEKHVQIRQWTFQLRCINAFVRRTYKPKFWQYFRGTFYLYKKSLPNRYLQVRKIFAKKFTNMYMCVWYSDDGSRDRQLRIGTTSPTSELLMRQNNNITVRALLLIFWDARAFCSFWGCCAIFLLSSHIQWLAYF